MTVTAPPIVAEVRNDLSLAQIARVAGEFRSEGILQGLTVVEAGVAPRWERTLAGLDGAPRCAWLKTLVVEVAASSATIFVPSEYPPGSCEHEEVLRHEREHEDAHRRTWQELAETLRADFARADWLPGPGNPLRVSSEEEADARIEAGVRKIVDPAYERHRAELAERNAVLDLPENYRWHHRRCKAWK